MPKKSIAVLRNEHGHLILRICPSCRGEKTRDKGIPICNRCGRNAKIDQIGLKLAPSAEAPPEHDLSAYARSPYGYGNDSTWPQSGYYYSQNPSSGDWEVRYDAPKDPMQLKMQELTARLKEIKAEERAEDEKQYDEELDSGYSGYIFETPAAAASFFEQLTAAPDPAPASTYRHRIHGQFVTEEPAPAEPRRGFDWSRFWRNPRNG